MINCRGEKCREDLVKKYTITLLSYRKMLNEPKKLSCTQMDITDTYYLFDYINKSNPKDKGVFYCGNVAGPHFLKLINSPGIPLFDPLKSDTTYQSEANQNSHNGNTEKKWNDVTLELYNAINLLMICWDKPMYGVLAKIHDELLRFRDKEAHSRKIEIVNNIIGKDFKKRSLSAMLEVLRMKNPKLKDFQFKRLNGILEERKIDSNF